MAQISSTIVAQLRSQASLTQLGSTAESQTVIEPGLKRDASAEQPNRYPIRSSDSLIWPPYSHISG